MRDLPTRAQIYIAVVWVLGTLAVAAAILLPGASGVGNAWEIGIFVLLGMLAGRTKVRLIPCVRDEDTASMSLGFALIFAALLRFGPQAGMLVGFATTLCACLVPKRHPLHQLTFNLALNVFETFLCGVCFLYLNGGTLDLTPLRSFTAVMVATTVFFVVDTFGIATIVALCTDQKPFATWKETFVWTAPSFFAGAGISTAVLLILGPHIGTLLLFLLPMVCLIYQAYSLYTARAQEREEHIVKLQRSEAELACALEREQHVASALQNSFLIRVPDGTFPGLSVDTKYEAASDEALIGGDFYDTFALPGSKVAVVVGDASGKGLAAAVRIAQIKYALRAYAHESASPGAALARLNDFECDSQGSEGRPFGSFVVLSLAVIDTNTGEVAISSAGTEPPLILRATGEGTVVFAGGMPLGVSAGETYSDSVLHLSPGDIVSMMTDGITESRHGGQILGYEGFMRIASEAQPLGSLPQIGQAIMDGARSFAQGKLQDDACLLLAQWKARDEHEVCESKIAA